MRSFLLVMSILGFVWASAQEIIPLKNFSFSQAEKMQNQYPEKPILVFIHTDWCGYCRRMEATTFSDKRIIQRLNELTIFISFNAENYQEDILFRGEKYQFIRENPRKGFHELAYALAADQEGRMSYPTLVAINSSNDVIFRISSFIDQKMMDAILDLF